MSSLTTSRTILAFKAGRAFRREGTNIVEPDLAKGAIVLERGDDELLHFQWKSRTSSEEEVRTFRLRLPIGKCVLTKELLGFDSVPFGCNI